MRSRSIHAALLLLVTASVAVAQPSAVLHQPPASAGRGQSVPIAVVLEGAVAAGTSVVCWYRPQGGREFLSTPLRPVGRGRFEGEIPASATDGFQVSYFLAAASRDRSQRVALGSREVPFTVRLAVPPGASGPSVGSMVLVGTGAALAVGVAIALWSRRRKRLHSERLFWVRTLSPYVHLRDSVLREQMARLAASEMERPGGGTRAYGVEFLVRKVAEVRSLDLNRLLSECARRDGDGAAAAAPAGGVLHAE